MLSLSIYWEIESSVTRVYIAVLFWGTSYVKTDGNDKEEVKENKVL